MMRPRAPSAGLAAKLAVGLAFGVLVVVSVPGVSNAVPLGSPDQTIRILCADIVDQGCADFQGTTNDGTIFSADALPTNPSTGTGVFQPFKRIQRSTGKGKNGSVQIVDGKKVPSQNGFNTDAGEPGINFDMKNGSQWTRSVLMGEFERIDIGGTKYIELVLDANQLGKATSELNRITITDMQIYIGSDPDLANPEATNTGVEGTGYTGTIFAPSDNSLLGLAPVWTLDSAMNGDVDVILQASICSTKGQCGSGKGDLSVLVPLDPRQYGNYDYFVFYSEYLYANDGFEEWRFRDDVFPVPEPASLAVFGLGLLGFGVMLRRRRSA